MEAHRASHGFGGLFDTRLSLIDEISYSFLGNKFIKVYGYVKLLFVTLARMCFKFYALLIKSVKIPLVEGPLAATLSLTSCRD